jgi:hypothetical protein
MARLEPGFGALRTFAVLDHSCDLEVLLEGTHERLARAIHADYLRHRKQPGRAEAADPALSDWEALPEVFRESSRRQADHVAAKLSAIGCSITPLSERDAEHFQFSSDEIEALAGLEHARWVEERRQGGWTTGPRSEKRMTTPYLIPYDDLPEPVKELNRNAVRQIPALLVAAGLQVSRDSPRPA